MIIISKKDSLPVYGVGPYLIAAMFIISILGLILSYYNMIPVYKIDSMYWLFVGLAVVLILDAAFLWLAAVRMSDISKRIENGELVSDDVYALVRHPIYSAWLQISIAIILFSQNIYLFILPIIFWIILSIALARTEEKWLTDKFGNDYVLYAQTTNRFVPFSRLR